MNKKDFIVLTAIVNNLIDLGVDVKEHIPEDRMNKYLQALEGKFSSLENDEELKKELIRELEKYVKRIN